MDYTRPQIGIAAGAIRSFADVKDGLEYLVSSITFGSFTDTYNVGNTEEPTYVFDQETRASWNGKQLPNRGIPYFLSEELPKLGVLKKNGCAIRVSFAPRVVGDIAIAMRTLHASPYISLIEECEINLACPNHRDEAGRLHDVLAFDLSAACARLNEVGDILPCKISIKIAPDMPESLLHEYVILAGRLGFSSIVSGNTRRVPTKSILSVPHGGMGGAPLLEAGLRQVQTLRSFIDILSADVRPRLIGCGGAMSAGNVRQYFDAGADEVQLGTYYHVYGARGVRDLIMNLA